MMASYFRLIIVCLIVEIVVGLRFETKLSHAAPISKSQIRTLLEFSNIRLKPQGYGCEESGYRSVGDVLAEMLDAGLSRQREIDFNCREIEKSLFKQCTTSYSNCTEWEKTECNSLILEFKMNSKTQKVDPNSFQCLQVP